MVGEDEHCFLPHVDSDSPAPHQLGFPVSVSSLRTLFITITNKWMQLLLLRHDKFLFLLAEKNRAPVTIGHP